MRGGVKGKPYVSPHWVTDAWSDITDDRVVRVVVDAAGGDNAPDEIVKGALDAVGPQLQVVFVGDEPRIRAAAARRACRTSAWCTPPR